MSILVKVILMISFLGLISCGQVKTTADNQTKNNQPQTDQTKPDQAEPDQASDDSAPKETIPTNHDQPFSPVKEKEEQPSNQASTPPVKDIPDTSVKVDLPPKKLQEPQQVAQSVVMGLGADGEDVKQLLDKGYMAAIFEAKVCSVTGAFSNHMRCFMVFKDGHSEWVNANNQHLILPFITELQAAANDSKKETKPKNKKHHHFLFF